MTRPTRVAVTLEQCWHRVPGGTAAAALSSLRALQAHTDYDLVGVAARHRRPPDPAWVPSVPVHQLPLPRLALYEAWHQLRRPPVQWATGPVDLIHVTGMAMPPRTAPMVVTVHDLAFLHDPEHFTGRGVSFFNRAVELARRDADIVVCPSRATVEDCLAHGFEPERLRLVPWGIEAPRVTGHEVERVRSRYDLRRRYVFGAGTIEPRKNLAVLLEAFARLDDPDVELVLAGPLGWGDEVLAGAERLGGRLRLLGFVPTGDLAPLYAGAELFCYPSLREGFGLPVLEAMAQGTPVVTSRGTATEEVLGDGEAGALVDPHDIAELESALGRLLGDDGRRSAAADAAAARAATFTWERMASGLRGAYEEALGVAAAAGVAPAGPRARAVAHPPRPRHLRVGVNLLWLVPGVVGGSEEYTTRLLDAIADELESEDHPIDLTLFVNRRFPGAHPALVERFSTEVAPVDGGSKPWRVAAESSWLAWRTRRLALDVVHHAGGIVPVVRPAPAVVTIHDLQPLAMPDFFSPAKRWFARATIPYAARTARAVVTLSEFTRDDVVARLGSPVERIALVTPGLDPVRDRPADELASVADLYRVSGRPFFLYPAITYPHKNHLVLIDAFAEVVRRHPEALLVLSNGPAQCEQDLLARIEALGLDGNVRRVGRIPGSDLDALYELATAVVFPSRFEGFGLPVLEAMRRGCPVVASTAGALPEVVGRAALVADPEDRAGWTRAMIGLLEDPALRAELSVAGPDRVAVYDWRVSARRLLAVYRAVAAGEDLPPATRRPV